MTFRDSPKNRSAAETCDAAEDAGRRDFAASDSVAFHNREAIASETIVATDFPTTRVVKLGGSLLVYELLRTRLHEWLNAPSSCATLLVVGGGELADAVRQLDQRYGWPAREAHDQAIRAMQVNAFVLSRLCPELNWIAELDDWTKVDSAGKTYGPPRRAILDPALFLQNEEPVLPGPRLPCGWQVTSDSIAARLAQIVGATELVLLKSTLPFQGAGRTTIQEAAAAGYIDQHFSLAAEHLPHVRAVNLRDHTFPSVRLTR